MANIVSSVRVRYEPLRSIVYSSITTSYQVLGTPLANPSRIFKITNLTDEPLFLSVDGINNYDVVAANAAFVYDFGSNRSEKSGLFEESQNDQIYVKAINTLPTLGSVYLTTIYASQV